MIDMLSLGCATLLLAQPHHPVIFVVIVVARFIFLPFALNTIDLKFFSSAFSLLLMLLLLPLLMLRCCRAGYKQVAEQAEDQVAEQFNCKYSRSLRSL